MLWVILGASGGCFSEALPRGRAAARSSPETTRGCPRGQEVPRTSLERPRAWRPRLSMMGLVVGCLGGFRAAGGCLATSRLSLRVCNITRRALLQHNANRVIRKRLVLSLASLVAEGTLAPQNASFLGAFWGLAGDLFRALGSSLCRRILQDVSEVSFFARCPWKFLRP